MLRRIPVLLGLSLSALLLVGCQGDREMKAKVLTMEQRTGKQFNLLKQQNEFMNRKVNSLNEKVEELTERNSELSEELATYANRPDEVKLEIIQEVNTMRAAMATDMEMFKSQLTKSVDDRFTQMQERRDTEFADMRKTLNHHTEFVQFVAAEQDSINRLFANRIDSRPWYQSIIGKWEDKERADAESSLP